MTTIPTKTADPGAVDLDRYVRRLAPEQAGGYSASIHEFPGCFAEGDTADEALQALEGAARAWISAAEESGRAIPLPVDLLDYSGRIALRVPRSLHRIAAERALLEGTSLNQLLVTAISHYLGQQDGLAKSVETLRGVGAALTTAAMAGAARKLSHLWNVEAYLVDLPIGEEMRLGGARPTKALTGPRLATYEVWRSSNG